jgi:DNA replication licensing factor MCM4
MEQQTVSVAKAGIVCSLNARCAILASANPVNSSYDPNRSVVDNINLPKNLMTRFDFIWLMLDKRNRELDRQLALHLISMYSEGPRAGGRQEQPIEPELFRRYVNFARRWVRPVMTEEASEGLVSAYLELRNQGTSSEVITATPRVLESLIRISEALAKMELRERVTAEDIEEAKRLIKAATYQALVDPETGRIDMDQLVSGVSAASGSAPRTLKASCRKSSPPHRG